MMRPGGNTVERMADGKTSELEVGDMTKWRMKKKNDWQQSKL